MSLTAEGFLKPTFEELREKMVADFKAAFGDNIRTDPQSNLGLLIDIQTENLATLYDQLEALYNSIDPDNATGDALSRRVKLNSIERQEAVRSTVDLTVSGDFNTVFPAGSRVAGVSGTPVFITDFDITIPATGTISVPATAEDDGAIIANAGTLTNILTPIAGVDSVTNDNDAIVGRLRETDAQLRLRRIASIAINSTNTSQAIRARLLNVPGVSRVSIINNPFELVDSFGTPPKSFQPIVLGGQDQDIIDVIGFAKPLGIFSYGVSVSGIYIDPEDNQIINVGFTRPNIKQIAIEVTLLKESGYPVDGDDQIKQALVDYFNGTLAGITFPGYNLGDSVIYSRLYTPLNSVIGHQVLNLQIGELGQTLAASNVPVAANELPVLELANITIL